MHALAYLDTPSDRTGGIGVALARRLDARRREWWDELAMEQDRVEHAFGSSLFDLFERED